MNKFYTIHETNFKNDLDSDKWYYKSQLNKLDPKSAEIQIVVNDSEGNKTNYMNLNNDSIDVMIEFLTKLKNEAK